MGVFVKQTLKGILFQPLMVNKLVDSREASMKVLRSAAQWFGVTYKEDKPETVANIQRMVQAGVYPSNLWE